MKKGKCKICGEKSINEFCKRCGYLLKNGANEETIRKMLSDDRTNNVWKENKERANNLAYAYYGSLLDSYDKDKLQKDSKENFGFNMFADGINMGLDIIMPLLDEANAERVLGKIENMLEIRRKNEK